MLDLWNEMTCLDLCCPCVCPALHCGSGKYHAKFWRADPHSGLVWDFAAFLRTQYSVSWFHSHAAFTKQKYPLRHMSFFLHYLNYHTGICCFPMQALNLFITIRCYSTFSAMMSHAMPWHCDVVHPTQSTVRAYSEVIVHSQRASSDSRHGGASIETNNTTYSFRTCYSSTVSLSWYFLTSWLTVLTYFLWTTYIYILCFYLCLVANRRLDKREKMALKSH